MELPRYENPLYRMMPLIAAADGYGVDWAEPPSGDSPAELTLRLVKDQPIQGRILSTEGKPVAGARLTVVTLMTTAEGRLDTFLNAWKQGWRNVARRDAEALRISRWTKS